MGNRRHPRKCVCESQTQPQTQRGVRGPRAGPRRVLGPEDPGEGLSPGRETAQPPRSSSLLLLPPGLLSLLGAPTLHAPRPSRPLLLISPRKWEIRV